MNPVFFADPVWLSLVKVLLLFVVLLLWTIFNVWYERRVLGRMQNRMGPVMNGPFGLGQALGDGAKLIFKEDYRPANTDPLIFNLAPLLSGFAAFTAWAVVPFAGEVTMFGVETRLQLTDLPVAALFVLAIASIGIYGIVLAGWSSSNSYSFLGGVRSAAQMISYELAMGLAIVAVLMRSGSMSTYDIVEAQNQPIQFGNPFTGELFMNGDHSITGWYFFLLFPAFVIYIIAMTGETNRAPFDLPECESELVSGFMTDYSGFRYAIFFLAEYINMLTVSAMAVTFFLGGYLAPWPLNMIPFLQNGWWGVLFFMVKVQLVFTLFMWFRGATWRFRYDHFMNLGWKYLIEIALVYLIMVMIYPEGSALFGVLTTIGVYFIYRAKLRKDLEIRGPKEMVEGDEPFDAYAGGYPVPPMPGQKLPELASVVSGQTEESTDKEEGK